MRFLSKKEVNNGRQFEFDLAKAVCILGMVIVHCFELLPLNETTSSGTSFYIFTIVLNAIFGAGTFMACMGAGITYSKHANPNQLIKRGLLLFLFGYLFNIFRYVLPGLIYFASDNPLDVALYLLQVFTTNDILQFAGLSILLFGVLKKIKLPDYGILILAIAMSIVGSFVRFIQIDNYALGGLLGNFVGTVHNLPNDEIHSFFPLLNWFIIVVAGYLFGKMLKRCLKIEILYAISTSISAVILIVYMAIAIPNRLGMMCGNRAYYFQMTSLDAIVVISGAIFAFGLYHYVSKLFSLGLKTIITRLSVNISPTYCIHYIIIGWLSNFLYFFGFVFPSTLSVFAISIAIYIVSTLGAELYRKCKIKWQNHLMVKHNI